MYMMHQYYFHTPPIMLNFALTITVVSDDAT